MSDLDELRFQASNAITVAPIVTEFVSKATADIVSNCTRLYNSGRLTSETAIAGWAQIAALDKLVSEITNTVARAERAEARERKRAGIE